jgi:hypothetical protein
MAQQPWYRALIERLIQLERIRGILFEDLVRVDELLHLACVFILRRVGREGQ